MGLKFDRVDDLDKMFEKFASDPAKQINKKIDAISTPEEEEKRKKLMGANGPTREDLKIIK